MAKRRDQARADDEPRDPPVNVPAAIARGAKIRTEAFVRSGRPFVFENIGLGGKDVRFGGEVVLEPMGYSTARRDRFFSVCVRRDDWVEVKTARDMVPPCLAAATNSNVVNCPGRMIVACISQIQAIAIGVVKTRSEIAEGIRAEVARLEADERRQMAEEGRDEEVVEEEIQGDDLGDGFDFEEDEEASA
jgi:hypothetical protein